ncbi:MAG: lytic transglycosylase domain-containing protein [Oscillospiraceae bacterium]|nr:lytic transglycosylase domain-containing protein [Oscillospiraceae bacterium]
MQRRKRNAARVVCLFALICLLLAFFGGVALVNRYFPLRYIDVVNEYARTHDLEPELILAVIHAESRFNSDAISRVGASGLMQIMENTAYWLAPQIGLDGFNYEAQIFCPEINIRMGTFYLNMLINRFNDLDAAIAAYNAGSGNVGRWLSNPDYSSDGVTLDHIPFPETRNFVERVALNRQIYAVILRFPAIFRR